MIFMIDHDDDTIALALISCFGCSIFGHGIFSFFFSFATPEVDFFFFFSSISPSLLPISVLFNLFISTIDLIISISQSCLRPSSIRHWSTPLSTVPMKSEM